MNIKSEFDIGLELGDANTLQNPKQTRLKTNKKNVSAQAKNIKDNRVNVSTHVYDTIIVGAGISGIAAAIKLKHVGYDNYIVIEKADRVGGTWRENTYPGCGCDVPSALYSYSFAPSHKWSHLFAKQPEILSYLEDVSDQFGIDEKIELVSNQIQDTQEYKKGLLQQMFV